MLYIRRKSPAPTSVQEPTGETSLSMQVQIEKPVTARPRSILAGSAADNYMRTEKVKKEIEEQLKSISLAYRQIDEAQAVVEQAFKIIEAQLRLVNLTEHSDGLYRAVLQEVWSRQSRTIDPKKFRTQVAADVFWSSIKVNLEKTKEHLSEREINNISDVIPPTMTGIALKVERVKKIKEVKEQ